MDINKTQEIWGQIKGIRNDDKVIYGLIQDLIKKAFRYARIRADWALMDTEQKQTRDLERTAAHNAFIDACNILSRNMAGQGLDIKWREQLGYDRKVIGDFACYIHAVLGLKNR